MSKMINSGSFGRLQKEPFYTQLVQSDIDTNLNFVKTKIAQLRQQTSNSHFGVKLLVPAKLLNFWEATDVPDRSCTLLAYLFQSCPNLLAVDSIDLFPGFDFLKHPFALFYDSEISINKDNGHLFMQLATLGFPQNLLVVEFLERSPTSEPIAASNPAILIDLSSNLLSGHTFYFRVLYFDEYMRLLYLISPPVSGRLSLYGEAKDEFGNQYDFVGGAYGLWRFAPCTEGVLSFMPLPKEGSEILTFRIEVRQGEERGEFSFAVLLK